MKELILIVTSSYGNIEQSQVWRTRRPLRVRNPFHLSLKRVGNTLVVCHRGGGTQEINHLASLALRPITVSFGDNHGSITLSVPNKLEVIGIAHSGAPKDTTNGIRALLLSLGFLGITFMLLPPLSSLTQERKEMSKSTIPQEITIQTVQTTQAGVSPAGDDPSSVTPIPAASVATHSDQNEQGEALGKSSVAGSEKPVGGSLSETSTQRKAEKGVGRVQNSGSELSKRRSRVVGQGQGDKRLSLNEQRAIRMQKRSSQVLEKNTMILNDVFGNTSPKGLAIGTGDGTPSPLLGFDSNNGSNNSDPSLFPGGSARSGSRRIQGAGKNGEGSSLAHLSGTLVASVGSTFESDPQAAANGAFIGGNGFNGGTGTVGRPLSSYSPGEGATSAVMNQNRSFLQLGSAESTVTEGLTRSEVEAVIQKHLSQVRRCYEAAVRQSEIYEGRMNVLFKITRLGNVSDTEIRGMRSNKNLLKTCLTNRIRTWKFGNPRGGQHVEVSYPFVFLSLRGGK